MRASFAFKVLAFLAALILFAAWLTRQGEATIVLSFLIIGAYALLDHGLERSSSATAEKIAALQEKLIEVDSRTRWITAQLENVERALKVDTASQLRRILEDNEPP